MKIYYLTKNKHKHDLMLLIRKDGKEYRSCIEYVVSNRDSYSLLRSHALKQKSKNEEFKIGLVKDYNVFSPWNPVVYIVK